jgi:photosystem II stability/assembly factor-like uncharacterized protein
MNGKRIFQSKSPFVLTSLSLAAGLLALSLVLLGSSAQARPASGSISGTVTYDILGDHRVSIGLFTHTHAPPPLPVATTDRLGPGPYVITQTGPWAGQVPLPNDTYYVSVFVDANDSGGMPDADDLVASYDPDGDGNPDPVTVNDNDVTNIDIHLSGLSWTPLGGPAVSGGQVNALAADPVVAGTAYAAVAPAGAYDSGPSVIYKTTDGAASWTPVYTADHQVYALGVTGTNVYAGAFNPSDVGASIYASHDGGASWTPVFTSTDRGVWLDASVHPTDPDVAVIGGWFYHDQEGERVQSGLVYRTDDAGLTWTPILTLTYPGAEAALNAVMIHPVTPTLLLASSHTWGGPNDQDSFVFRSDDGGATWPLSVTMPDAHVVSFAANTSRPEMIYAGAGGSAFTSGPNYVFRSADAGLSWTEVFNEGGGRLAFEPPGTVYAGARGGEVWSSTSDGDPGTWDVVGGLPDVWSFDIDLGSVPTALYAGAQEQGVFKSTDGGHDWEERNNGIGTVVRPVDIDVDPQNPDKLFVAAECSRGWMTTDGGETWIQPPVSSSCIGAFAINPEDPEIVYGGQYVDDRGSVVRSEDGGLSFASVYTAPFIRPDGSGGGETIFDIAMAPSMTSTVYAAGADKPDWSDDQAVVVRSLDDGASWTVVFTQPEWSRIEVVTIDPSDADVVYIGGEACDQFGCEGTIYRSIDGGDSWQATMVSSHTIGSIVVDYQKPNVVYAATRDPYDVYKSADGGDSWTLIRSNDPPFEEPSGYLLAIDPHVPSHVYLGGWGYIAETPDGGQTWSDWEAPINNGTPGMEPRALAVDNGAVTQTLYAGFSGVWTYRRAAPQPGAPMTVTAQASAPSAQAGETVTVSSLVVDQHVNWVADGTLVTFTTSPEGSFASHTVAKMTTDGRAEATLTGVTSGTAHITVTSGVGMDTLTVEFTPFEIYLPIVLRSYAAP